ncbi:hypothetical protein ACOME3_001102 [Neoechinorhynchus agilis]
MPLYGMDIAIAKKMASKRDQRMEQQAQEWLEDILGEKFPTDILFEDALKNGVYLCRLMNILSPGSISKINSKGSAFAFRENIQSFQRAARAYGVPDGELFHPMDLFEKRNIAQVTLCLYALSRQASKKGFPGPCLSHKKVYCSSIKDTPQQYENGCDRVAIPSLPFDQYSLRVKENSMNSIDQRSISRFNDEVNKSEMRFRRMKVSAIAKISESTCDRKSLLASLAKHNELSKRQIIEELDKYTERKLGRVEQSTIKEIIQDYACELSTDQSPLSEYVDILPELCCLILLEND